MEPLQSKMEQAEIQKYIDRYRHCPPEQLKKMPQEAAQFTPSQEQNLPLQYALVTLLEQTDKAPQEDPDAALSAFIAQHDLSGAAPPPKCWRRCMLIAAIITALLLFSAAAYAIQHYGLFLNIQETFTQPKTVPGPDALVASWTDTPVPTYSVLYLTYTDESNSTDNIGTVRNAFIIDPAEMNDSQKLSYMYYFATFMPREIDRYLILPTGEIKDYDNDFVNQARKCFIQGMANVIVRLRCGADKEIAAGIELISADLAQGNLSAFCIDPLGFYKRMKAIAAICRVYYMGIDDKIISIHIFQSDIEYPHLHFSALCTNQLPKWFQEAIQLSSKLMGTDISEKDIKRCVLDSFPNETAWKAWMINARYTAPEYVQLGPEAGDENSSFIFRVSPITVLDDPYIETLLQAVARKHPAKFGKIEG